jgi:transglutaminase/protease-like cytokinesis protein 3
MSTETKQVIDNTEVVKKDQLQSKYNKFKVFGHWIIGRIAEKLNNLDEEKKNALNLYEFMMDEHCLYSSVEDQTAYYEMFLEENPKFSLKDINKEVRKHNKPLKQKKLIDPDAPKKKRGRKKKVFENNVSEEEQYIANIVALQDYKIEEPILQLQSPQVYENTSPQEDTTQEDTTQEDTTQEDTTQEDTTQEDKPKKVKKSKVVDENKPKRKYTKKNKLEQQPLLEDPVLEEPLLEESLLEEPLLEESLLEEPLLEDNIIVSNTFQSLQDAVKELQDDDEFIPFEYNNQHLLINKFLHVFDKTANKHIASLQNLSLIFH